jgi:hypothetical protein
VRYQFDIGSSTGLLFSRGSDSISIWSREKRGSMFFKT